MCILLQVMGTSLVPLLSLTLPHTTDACLRKALTNGVPICHWHFRTMSFADLPPELVLHITAALRGTREIFALMRANSGLYCLLKRSLYQYNVDYENSSGLVYAVKEGNLSATWSFLKTARVDLDARDKTGLTLLHVAAQQGDTPHIMLLLRDGRVDINATDSQGRTALVYSASNRNVSPLTKLLQRQNIDINVADSGGQTALFHAAKAGNEIATDLLLKRPDVETNVLDENYLTPLAHAASRGHLAVVNRFLQCPIIDFRPQNEHRSPLIIAVDNGHHSILKTLIESGNFDHHATDADGRSASGHAVRRRNCEAVRLLIESGVDAGRQEAAGITPLNMAVAQGDEDIVRMLLRVTPRHGELCLAAFTGRANIVQLLLDHGADIGEQDDYGRTPLVRARESGQSDVVRVLLNHGAT